MRKYVVGFLFSATMDKVVLIEKQKPEWQRGYLNGVGGKIEEGETPLEAMVREFEEETGVKTQPTHWTCYLEAVYDGDPNEGANCYLFLFKCIDYSNQFIKNVRTMEKEKIGVYETKDQHELNTVPNLKSFIPIAMNPDFVKTKVKAYLR